MATESASNVDETSTPNATSNVDETSTPNDAKSTSKPLVSASFAKLSADKKGSDEISLNHNERVSLVTKNSKENSSRSKVSSSAPKNTTDSTKQKDEATKNQTTKTCFSLLLLSVVAGNKGAYAADDDDYKYYIVQWKDRPYQAERDEIIVIGNYEFPVCEGDWLCRGVWLEKLIGGKNWHTMTKNHDECVVRLDTVLDAKLNMIEHHETLNPFKPGMNKEAIAIAKQRGAYRMTDEDHKRLIKEWHKRDKQEKERMKNKKVGTTMHVRRMQIHSLYPHTISILSNVTERLKRRQRRERYVFMPICLLLMLEQLCMCEECRFSLSSHHIYPIQCDGKTEKETKKRKVCFHAHMSFAYVGTTVHVRRMQILFILTPYLSYPM